MRSLSRRHQEHAGPEQYVIVRLYETYDDIWAAEWRFWHEIPNGGRRAISGYPIHNLSTTKTEESTLSYNSIPPSKRLGYLHRITSIYVDSFNHESDRLQLMPEQKSAIIQAI